MYKLNDARTWIRIGKIRRKQNSQRKEEEERVRGEKDMKVNAREKRIKILKHCQMPGEGERVHQSWLQGKGIFPCRPSVFLPGPGPGALSEQESEC